MAAFGRDYRKPGLKRHRLHGDVGSIYRPRESLSILWLLDAVADRNVIGFTDPHAKTPAQGGRAETDKGPPAQGSFFVPINSPEPGEIYRARLYPRQQCEVLRVINADVVIQWVGHDSYVEPQSIPVKRFILDFERS